MTTIPYILDILSQPQALRSAVKQFDPRPLADLAGRITRQEFDRIVLTGMGGSLFASYPVWLHLAGAGLPAVWVDTAELIHHTPALVTPRSLFWVFSQSGKSAEIVSAVDGQQITRPAALLGTVNDLSSPLAQAAQYLNPIYAEAEATVSTRTYVNTLAVAQLAALALMGQDVEPARAALLQTADAMQAYLETWEERVQRLSELLGFPKRLALLGRGPSLASAWIGTLLLGEAAKFLSTPYQAGEFRHGPLELATPDLTALLFGGTSKAQPLNARLLRDLRGFGAQAFWLGREQPEWQIELPAVPEIGLPLIEVVPIQLLSIHLAQSIGVEPGFFFRSGKVTLTE